MEDQNKGRFTLRFNDLATLSYLKQMSEEESEQCGEFISVNQIINRILTDYVSERIYPVSYHIEQMQEEINLQNKKIEALTESLHELIQALTID